jgi:predicted HTH domain antitoxin
MEIVNVSGLKNTPADVLRKAHEDLVLVMNRDRPEALMVGIQKSSLLDGPGVRLVLATALFRDGNLSLARGARLVEMSVVDFIVHLSHFGIPVVRLDATETGRDMDTLEEWLASF